MIELNNIAHKHLQRGTQEFQDLLATYNKQTKKVITAQDTFSGQKVHVQILYSKIKKFSSGESEKNLQKNKPHQTLQQMNLQRRNQLQVKLQTSACSSLKSDKSGPSSYQKK